MRFVGIAVVAVALGGCAGGASQEPGWYAAKIIDPITDEESCTVSFAPFAFTTGLYAPRGKLYPFVQKRGQDVYVGFASYGIGLKQVSLFLPVGGIEFRIGRNAAHTVVPTETPALFTQSAATSAMAASFKKSMENQGLKSNPAMSAIAESNAAAMQGVTAAMAPVTAVGGEKARSILSELKAGSMLTYRVQNPAAPLEPGQIPLEGINEKLAKCGL